MKRHMLNLTLLGVFTVAAIGPWRSTHAQPSVEGQWDAVPGWPSDLDPNSPNFEFRPIHMILLENGKVLCLAFPSPNDAPTRSMLFDPVAGTFVTFDGPADPADPTLFSHHLLSSGHVALAHGRILFVAGRGVTKFTTIYDPDTPPGPASWLPQEDNPAERFYPTCTTLADGTVLTMAGDGTPPPVADTPAIFDSNQPPGQQWTPLTDATYLKQDETCPFPCNPANDFHLHQYPFMFLLSSGEVVFAGSDDASEDGEGLLSTPGTRTLNPASEVWTDVVDQIGNPINDPIRGGSAVMYQLDKIMKAGGRVTEGEHAPAIPDVYTLDATAPNPAWTQQTFMTNLRTDHYLVVLPDGKILAVGGRDHVPTDVFDPFNVVLQPELYDPTTNTWQPMASMPVARHHHSAALLLPDARVLVAGGNDFVGAETFSPPYLFVSGGGLADRATISGIGPDTNKMYYGGTGSVTLDTPLGAPDANDVSAVSLIRLGSATHGFDFDQRFLDLSFTVAGPGKLSVDAPANPNEAPPGYYMLFVLTTCPGGTCDTGAQPPVCVGGFLSGQSCTAVPSETANGVSNIVQVAPCPSVAPPTAPTAPTGEAGFDKHRVISIVPQNLGEQTAIRVTHTATGFQYWVGPPADVTENSSNVNPIQGWPNFKAARLQCSSHSTDWGAFGETIHVYGPQVVPSASYDFQAIHGGCDETDESLFSAPLTVVTSQWGDIVSLLGCPFPTAPGDGVNISDILAVLDKFGNEDCAVIKARADTEPELLDMLINISDALQVSDAFSGVPYPFSPPQECP